MIFELKIREKSMFENQQKFKKKFRENEEFCVLKRKD